MNKLDYCIKMQFRMIAGELVAAGFLLVVAVLFLYYGGFGGEGYQVMNAIGTSGFLAAALLGFSALRKLFVRSVYGGDSGLYQALPLTAGEQITSKIFTAGIFLLLAFLPIFLIYGSGLGSLYAGKYRISAAIIQVLVNLGYTHSQVPLFAAAAVVAAVLGCFAAAAAVQFVIVWLNRKRRDGTKRSVGSVIVETVFAVLALTVMTFLNLLPYWLLIRSGEMHLLHPAMVPGTLIFLNGAVMLAEGKGSVKAVETRY